MLKHKMKSKIRELSFPSVPVFPLCPDLILVKTRSRQEALSDGEEKYLPQKGGKLKDHPEEIGRSATETAGSVEGMTRREGAEKSEAEKQQVAASLFFSFFLWRSSIL